MGGYHWRDSFALKISSWARRRNPPPPPSGNFGDIYRFKALPERVSNQGRQQNPEHGTFRNIPEQGKLSQNK